VIRHQYGPDVTFLDRALEQLFGTYAVDPERIAIAGFSDGASYALSLGLINGCLFRDVLAFSPGFAAPTRTEDAPKIFVSHGRQDAVLPVERCGRKVSAALKQSAMMSNTMSSAGAMSSQQI
jgi:predicted esterase